MEFEAPDFSKQGVKTFVEFLGSDSIKNMIQDNIFCNCEEKIIERITLIETIPAFPDFNKNILYNILSFIL